MALCIPPDLILTVLEGMTAIIHYCLLDPTSQYHQVGTLEHCGMIGFRESEQTYLLITFFKMCDFY